MWREIIQTRLFRRYAIMLGGLVGVLFTAAGAIEIYASWRENVDRVTEALRSEANGAAHTIREHIRGVEFAVSAVATLPWSSNLLTLRDRESEFRWLLRTYPIVHQIAYLDSANQLLLEVSKDEPTDWMLRKSKLPITPELIQDARLDELAIGPAYFGESNQPFALIAFRDRNLAKGISLLAVNMQYLKVTIDRLKVGRTGIAYLVDQDGNVVSHPNFSMVTTRRNISDIPRLSNAIQASGVLTPVFTKNFQGVDVLTAAAPVPRSRWYVFVEQDQTEAMQGIVATAKRTLLTTVGALFGSLFIAFFIARSIAKPVLELKKTATDMAAGNLGLRLRDTGRDEIEEASGAFNRMAESLQKYYAGLEKTIADKTAELDAQFRHRAEQDQRIAILEERTRIMRDIHDGVGGHLVGLLAAAKNDRIDAKHVESVAQQALVDFRIAIDSLAPVEGDFQTVLGTLRYRLAKQLEAAGIQSEWTIGDLPQLSDQRRESVFNLQRIVSEALTNAIKHARATKVWVDAHWADETQTLTVSVADNGLGITPGLTAGVGLQSMTKRAKAMGAELLVEPNPVGKGTVVRLVLVDPKASAALTV